MKYDFIIRGAGCAGLTLAFLLNQSELKHKKILLIDVKKKVRNDRTFCFWENEENLFENIVFKKWKKLEIKKQNHILPFQLKDYTYKMIRGIDLYDYVKTNITANPNIQLINEKIIDFESAPDGVKVKTQENEYFSDYYFNSLTELTLKVKNSNYHSLTQHFLGWYIESEDEPFNPELATFMDYSVPQNNDLRFCYVLPYSKTGALVEYTLFSKEILKAQEYKEELARYIKNNLKIYNYKIIHKEYGKILMTNYPFQSKINKNIINIGIPAGKVKPSCGFAFKRIKTHCEYIVKSMEKGKMPVIKNSLWHKRFRLYDSTFLNVLTNKNVEKKEVFFRLFKYNHIHKVFRLLDEKTNVFEEIRIFITVHVSIFLKAIFSELFRIFGRKALKSVFANLVR